MTWTPERRFIAELDNEVCMGHLENVSRLLEAGANVNGRNVVGDTPLMAAAHTGQPDMVRLLLRFGADVSLTDRLGKTALQDAQQLNHIDVLEAFTEHGVV